MSRLDDDVVRLDLGPSHDGARARRDDATDAERTGERPWRAWLERLHRTGARVFVPLVVAVLLVAATAGPQPRPLPSGDDLRVTLTAGPLVPLTLDTLTVGAELTNQGPAPVDVRVLRLVGSGDAGAVVPPVTVPVGGSAEVSVAARPDCARPGDELVAVELGTPGGGASLELRPAGAASAFAELCPSSAPGAQAWVTGSRTDASGTGVEVRVVNRGTVRVLVGPSGTGEQRRPRGVVESGAGPAVEETGGPDAPPLPLPLLAGYPQLPVGLDPGEAAVVTLLPIVDPCATDATAATLQADGPRGLRPVGNQDVVRAQLLAAAAVLCAQRG